MILGLIKSLVVKDISGAPRAPAMSPPRDRELCHGRDCVSLVRLGIPQDGHIVFPICLRTPYGQVAFLLSISGPSWEHSSVSFLKLGAP